MGKKKLTLLAVILLLTIGFAAVSATLFINGNVHVGKNQNDFDIYFSDAKENGLRNLSVIKDKTHIEFEVTLITLDEVYEIEYVVKNNSRNYDAEIKITAPESNEQLEIVNVFDESTPLLASDTRTGTLRIKLIKGTVEESGVEYRLNLILETTAIERNRLANKIIDIYDGDEEVCIGTECFYVLSNDEDHLKLFAKYNLNVGDNLSLDVPVGVQNEAIGYGYIPFATTDMHGEIVSDYEGSLIEQYVNNYAEYMNRTYDLNVIGDILTKEEVEALLGKTLGTDNSLAKLKPEWVYDSNFWLKTPVNTAKVWGIGNKAIGYNNPYWATGLGVRPILIIKK